MPTITISQLGKAAAARAIERLAASRLDEVLVSQAKRRIHAGGDSEHQYPGLWDNSKSFRSGGSPLLDTATHILNALSGARDRTSNGVNFQLVGPLLAFYHQHGFETSGPNFIPLTIKARRVHVAGVNPDDEDLVEGVDYVIAWAGVTVPQRKIFNLPPEDVAEFAESVNDALR